MGKKRANFRLLQAYVEHTRFLLELIETDAFGRVSVDYLEHHTEGEVLSLEEVFHTGHRLLQSLLINIFVNVVTFAWMMATHILHTRHAETGFTKPRPVRARCMVLGEIRTVGWHEVSNPLVVAQLKILIANQVEGLFDVRLTQLHFLPQLKQASLEGEKSNASILIVVLVFELLADQLPILLVFHALFQSADCL